ncbi:MAG TPA: phospho-N-acetylmuramoyl-pentapeptide-transferase [Fibrobacteres bacterium]|nr:phospho-N-acetylmuramoyl-pentapeptide-transferase [Fibrobacterota bacterium]
MLSLLLFHLTHVHLFEDRLFRAGAASLFTALLVFLAMPHYIAFLKRRDATADFDHQGKPPPPILGGMLLVIAVIAASLCFAKLNAYSGSALVILTAYAAIGAVDDLMKVRNKRLVALGKISRADYQAKADGISARLRMTLYILFSLLVAGFAYKFIPGLSGHVTLPFVKPEVWFPHLPNWAFIALICLVTTASANGANFTDGLDSLVSVPLITTALFAGVVAYISGNAIFAKYFLIPYIPGGDELFPICTPIIGAMLAYLWYNSPPAEIYMGDAGSIGLGGAIGIMFVLLRIELFLPIVGAVLVAEALSVLLQITGFKFTRRFSSDGQGRRLFLRAPLHHHYQMKWKGNFDSPQALNSKILWRFHLVSILALILGSLIFFKVR